MNRNLIETYKWILMFATLLFIALLINAAMNYGPNYDDPISSTSTKVSTKVSNITNSNSSMNSYSDICSDAVTAEEYKSCLEDIALDDWHNEQVANAGAP